MPHTITDGRAGVERYKNDPLALRALNPMFGTFPDSSMVDFSFLLDPPAGKHGFVEVTEDGNFRIAKTGERIRFWGVTVAANHVDVEKARIAEAVDVIARSGCNLLRLHELDNRGGEQYNLVRRNIIDEAYPNNNKSTVFDEEYRDRVDYWISCAQQKGMYVYLVVRGYRTFREGDGVPNADKLDRSAKPYAFFDPRLIELQKQYANEWLIQHVNPYTGVPNGLNPAVALIEVENEDSLFFGHVDWREFVEPYRANFKKMWNDWLIKEYKDTAGLRKAWTNDKGECALPGGESPEAGTVEVPLMSIKALKDIASIPWMDPLKSPARTRDGARFAAQLQRDYFVTLRDFLHAKGCRAPFTAVVHAGVVMDSWTATRELDFAGENAYLDHPSFSPGATWVGRAFYSNKNYIKETGLWSLGQHMARYSWEDVPLVCREWATCWPNDYRSSAAFDIASYSLLQDYDGLIHFAYYTWGNPDMIQAFGPQADPARWGLFGYAAYLFERGLIAPEARPVVIAYSNEDLAVWASYYSPFYKLAYSHRVVNRNLDDNPNMRAGKARPPMSPPSPPAVTPLLTISTGRDGTTAFTGGNLLLFDARYAERRQKPEALRKQGLIVHSGYDFPWIYAAPDFSPEEVRAAGFEPALNLSGRPRCLAFYDPKRINLVLAEVDEETAARAAGLFADKIAAGQAWPRRTFRCCFAANLLAGRRRGARHRGWNAPHRHENLLRAWGRMAPGPGGECSAIAREKGRSLPPRKKSSLRPPRRLARSRSKAFRPSEPSPLSHSTASRSGYRAASPSKW